MILHVGVTKNAPLTIILHWYLMCRIIRNWFSITIQTRVWGLKHNQIIEYHASSAKRNKKWYRATERPAIVLKWQFGKPKPEVSKPDRQITPNHWLITIFKYISNSLFSQRQDIESTYLFTFCQMRCQEPKGCSVSLSRQCNCFREANWWWFNVISYDCIARTFVWCHFGMTIILRK